MPPLSRSLGCAPWALHALPRARPEDEVRLTVYTDGSGTTRGPAGIAYVALGDDLVLFQEGSLGLDDATNQQAEILAAAYALHCLAPGPQIEIVSDSEYLVKGWNDFPKRKRKKNLAHWARLTAAAEGHKDLVFRWTKGHAGSPGNERADKLAREARRAKLDIVEYAHELAKERT